MRTIKFRAWFKPEQRMHSVNTIGFTDRFIDTNKYNGDLEDFVLMQFTGLTDMNGEEIYEGDICLIKNTSEFITSTHMQGIRAVEWNDENCHLWFSGCIPLVWGGHESIEVIGNIYQNHELLK